MGRGWKFGFLHSFALLHVLFSCSRWGCCGFAARREGRRGHFFGEGLNMKDVRILCGYHIETGCSGGNEFGTRTLD